MNRSLKSLWAMMDDDAYGSTMELWFGVADVVYHTGLTVPLDWQYRHSPVCTGTFDNWPDAEIQTLYDIGDVTGDELIYFGQILARYASILQAMGKGY